MVRQGARAHRAVRTTDAVFRAVLAARAFVARDVAIRLSYRAKLSLSLLSSAVTLVTLTFVGRVVAGSGPGFQARYGMSYTTFALVGVIVHGAAATGLHAFRASLRREQLQGTLEVLLSSGLPPPVLIVLSGVGDVLVACAGGAALAAVCSRVFGFPVHASPSLVAASACYVAAMCGLGLASAGIVVVCKEGDPVGWTLGGLSSIAGGVYFPVDVLPPWLAAFSRALPTTHALHAVRAAAVRGGAAAGPDPASLRFLAAAAIVSVATGLLVLLWGLRRSRRLGTLGEY